MCKSVPFTCMWVVLYIMYRLILMCSHIDGPIPQGTYIYMYCIVLPYVCMHTSVYTCPNSIYMSPMYTQVPMCFILLYSTCICIYPHDLRNISLSPSLSFSLTLSLFLCLSLHSIVDCGSHVLIHSLMCVNGPSVLQCLTIWLQ